MLLAAARRLGVARSVLALSLARMVDAASNSILIVVLPLYVLDVAAPLFGGLPGEVRVGLVISLYGALFAAAQPAGGWLADRLSRRGLILAGMGVMAVSAFGFVFAGSYLSVVGLRCLQGLAMALVIPATLVLVSDASEQHARGHAMGVYTTFRMIGFATGPLIGGLAVTYLGYGTAFHLSALSALLGAAVVLRSVPHDERPAPAPGARDGAAAEAGGAGPGATVLLLSLSSVLMAASLSMIATLEKELNDRLDQTPFWFGLAFSAFIVARLVFQIPAGRASDRLGRKPLIVAGLLALAPATALYAVASGPGEFLLLRMGQGVASAGIAAPAFAFAGDLAKGGRSPGRTMAWVSMGFGAGLAVGPILAGALAGYVGFAAPFYLVAGLSVLAALAFAVFAREAPRARPAPAAEPA